MTPDQAQEIIDRAAAALGEHFISVQIHVSFPMDGGGTCGLHTGSGDWYARQGLAHEFINQDQAQEIGHSVAKFTEE